MRKTKKGLKKKCWRLMSMWVRLKNADKNGYCTCITCGKKVFWKEIHAGHLRHGVLDFDPININPQCIYCNQYQSGQRDLYYRWAVKTYGHTTIDDLYQRADRAKKGELYSIEELQKLAINLTLKISELTK